MLSQQDSVLARAVRENNEGGGGGLVSLRTSRCAVGVDAERVGVRRDAREKRGVMQGRKSGGKTVAEECVRCRRSARHPRSRHDLIEDGGHEWAE